MAHRAGRAIHIWIAPPARVGPEVPKVVILTLAIARDITKHMIAMRKSPSIPALSAPRAWGIFAGT